MNSERAPFLPSSAKLSPKNVTRKVAFPTFLVLLPWLIFVQLCSVIVLIIHQFRSVVVAMFMFCSALSAAFFLMGACGNHHRPFYLVLGILCGFATSSGTLTGLYIYHEFTAVYYAAENRRAYGNVRPEEPASGHGDAGRLVFSDDARIDQHRVASYREADTVYCVAPIVGDHNESGVIEYWAAGEDCCGFRSAFVCGDAQDLNARSGIPIVDPGNSSSVLPADVEIYKKAALTAEGVYGLKSAQDALFVRWTLDPQAVQEQYWTWGIWSLGAACAAHFALSLLFGVPLGLKVK